MVLALLLPRLSFPHLPNFGRLGFASFAGLSDDSGSLDAASSLGAY